MTNGHSVLGAEGLWGAGARLLATALVVWVVLWVGKMRRAHDPDDYAALATDFEPRISVVRFRPFASVDPVTHDAGVAAVREFSRLYQSTYAHNTDGHSVPNALRGMALARGTARREFHELRMRLPNDAHADRAVLQGIVETDAAMAEAMAELSRRVPECRLMHGAGIVQDVVRAAGDTWP
jgi:hypothetical protein